MFKQAWSNKTESREFESQKILNAYWDLYMYMLQSISFLEPNTAKNSASFLTNQTQLTLNNRSTNWSEKQLLEQVKPIGYDVNWIA